MLGERPKSKSYSSVNHKSKAGIYSRFRERDTDLDVCFKRHHSEPPCVFTAAVTSMFWSKSHGRKCCM